MRTNLVITSCLFVQIRFLQDVNLKDSSLCGYLHIRGLTDEYPELTTFFDAEIIGNAYSFVTKKWDASSKTDKEHWVSVELAGRYVGRNIMVD